MTILKLASLGVVAALSLGTAASAAVTVFTDEASFLAALGTSGTDTYSDLGAGSLYVGPLVRSAGSFGYTTSVGPNSSIFFGGADGTDAFLSSDSRLDTISFGDFAAGVAGIGGYFFGSDFSGAPTSATSITLNITDADGTVSEVIAGPTTSSYRGFLSTGGLISLGVVVGNQSGVWHSIDDLTLGTAAAGPGVPEPAAWTLMIAGFGMVGATMRRRANRFAAVRA